MADLILGTAQFGPGYGITNDAQRISDDDVASTLRAAVAGGIRSFDTADGYGDSQERVGRLMPAGSEVGYISKFTLDGKPTPELLYERAIQRLRVRNLEGLLAHHAKDLSDDLFPRVLAQIREAKIDGRIGLIGASIYDEQELTLAVKKIPDLDLVQIPGSVVDRRLLDSKLLLQLKADGVKVHVRSAFLQGLLLSSAEKLTGRFADLRPVVHNLDSIAKSSGVSRLSLVLGFLKFHESVDAVVVGATSSTEITSILDAWAECRVNGSLALTDGLSLDIVDPRRW